ncbi:MAG: hypothetical protein F6K11_04550 [Leptolyngbya sp. SIO3F4]|nr:hypothetical protein [Leptolyngbya sp. SIO3F4]
MSDSSDNTVNPETDKAKTENVDAQEPETVTNEVTQLVDQLIRAKRITYSQYQTLSTMVLADGTVDEQERRQINRLFDAIQAGAIRIVE